MKNFFKLAVVAVFFAAQSAQAVQWGAFGGLNMTEYDADGTSFDSEIGFEVGGVAHIDLGGIVLRTGAGYVQKNSSFEVLGFDADVNLTYIEVPATALYFFNDNIGVFGGLNFDLNVGDDCEVAGQSFDCDPESFIYNLSLGGHFKITDMSRIEAQYEMGLTDVAEDTELASSLGVRYVHMF